MPRGQAKQRKSVEALTHEEDRRRNLPSAEHQPLMRRRSKRPSALPTSGGTATWTRSSYGAAKTSKTGPTLEVKAPPLYIQERVHPKVLIDDLMHQSQAAVTSPVSTRPTCSPTSTACRRRTPRPSSTSTMPTGLTA